MFKVLYNFNQITPRFLNFIFGLGRKTKSFDEDYMACYNQFSINQKAKSETLAENGDQSRSQYSEEKLGAKSYG